MPKKQKVVTRKQRKAVEAAQAPSQRSNSNASPLPTLPVQTIVLCPNNNRPAEQYGPVVYAQVRAIFYNIMAFEYPVPAAIRFVQLDLPGLLEIYALARGDLRERDEYGLSAIHHAAHLNRYDCARVLLTYAGGTARPHHPLTFLSLLTRR